MLYVIATGNCISHKVPLTHLHSRTHNLPSKVAKLMLGSKFTK